MGPCTALPVRVRASLLPPHRATPLPPQDAAVVTWVLPREPVHLRVAVLHRFTHAISRLPST